MIRRPATASLFASPSILFITGLLVLPVILMLILAFGIDVFGNSNLTSGKVEFFDRLFTKATLNALSTSLLLSLPVVAVCLLIGTGYAVLVTRVGKVLKSVLTGALFLPLLTGELVFGYGWLIILGRNGIVNQFLMATGFTQEPVTLLYQPFTVVVGLIGVLIPFAALPLATAYAAINPELRLAAATLGASRFQTTWFVIAPMLRAAALSGASIVYAISMSAYAVPALLGGRRVHTLPLEIHAQYITLFNWPAGSALAVVLVLVVLVPVRLLARAQSIASRET